MFARSVAMLQNTYETKKCFLILVASNVFNSIAALLASTRRHPKSKVDAELICPIQHIQPSPCISNWFVYLKRQLSDQRCNNN